MYTCVPAYLSGLAAAWRDQPTTMQCPISFENTPLTEDEIQAYVDWWKSNDLSPQGKREWLARLGDLVRGMQDVHTRLSSSASPGPVASGVVLPDGGRREVQLQWKREPNVRFTMDHLDRAIGSHRHGYGIVMPIPTILGVHMEDGYVLDARKRVQRELMCFVELATEGDAEMLLTKGSATIRYELTAGCYTSIEVKFVRPAKSRSQRAALLRIGSLVARLGELSHEFQELGAVRLANGTSIVPRLGKRMASRDEYAVSLERYEQCLAGDGRLGAAAYAYLAEKTPVDTDAVELRLAALFREECQALVQLRRLQIEGHDFLFDLPRGGE